MCLEKRSAKNSMSRVWNAWMMRFHKDAKPRGFPANIYLSKNYSVYNLFLNALVPQETVTNTVHTKTV